MSERRTKVLLIEDDPEDAMIIRDLLQHGEGPEAAFEVEAADSLEAGLAALDRAHFDVALVDLMLPDSSGIETFQRLHERHPDLPAVILSGLRDERLALAAVADGAQDYLLKGGIDSRAFKRAVRYAVERRRLARRLEGVLEGSADGMVVIDAGGTVRYANPAALALFGREAGEMVGKPFGHPLPARQSLSLTLPDPSGGERAGEMRVTEIEWQGAPARLASIRDVTVLRRLEQLKAEIRERHKVDELKDHFLHCVSHELRSPLTIVKAAVANLRDGLLGELNEAQLKMIQMADRNVGRINKIVSNLLDLSRLESGRASMNMRR
ncbi:MAG TPA: response regulator, partial [Elusimicrobiota bacterium]|nr:response regulator [Elusimicrobiota bacterium]